MIHAKEVMSKGQRHMLHHLHLTKTDVFYMVSRHIDHGREVREPLGYTALVYEALHPKHPGDDGGHGRLSQAVPQA